MQLYRPEAGSQPFPRQQGENSLHKVNMNDGDNNSSIMDYEYVQCGFGKLMWPDGSSFEGFWVNGYPVGIGIFRATNDSIFEGFWQQETTNGLSLFRQGELDRSEQLAHSGSHGAT